MNTPFKPMVRFKGLENNSVFDRRLILFEGILSKFLPVLLVLLSIVGFFQCKSAPDSAQEAIFQCENQVLREEILAQKHTPVYTYEIIKTYPHQTSAYTEGLLMDEGFLYESTGLYGQSKIMKTDLKSGKTLKELTLKPIYFGEGIAIMGDDLYHLSYKANTGFVYDKHSFKLKKTFPYPSEGWGLTTNGSQLIMSTGSSALLFLDPLTLAPKKSVVVKDLEREVGFLNELEYINGQVFANIWETDLIAIISPEDGTVTAWIDLTGINPDPQHIRYPHVLNGIAYAKAEDLILITGKCWPHIYGIRLVKKRGMSNDRAN
jgi:glutamine cyclotransferase